MIPMLNPGAPASAAHWNALFAEADAKIAAAMAGRNLLYLLPGNLANVLALTTAAQGTPLENPQRSATQPRGVVGWVTLFAGAGRRWITDGLFQRGVRLPSYDHDLFTAAAGTAPVTEVNQGFGFVRLAVPRASWAQVGLEYSINGGDDFFAASLEAHKRTHTHTPAGAVEPITADYFVYGDSTSLTGLPSAQHPQKYTRYAQAEIAFDGDYGGVFRVWPAYRKHRFWRFHNCQSIPVTVEFISDVGGVEHTLTVPARGSRCTRWYEDAGSRVYVDGWQYLQRMVAGQDVRFMNMGVAAADTTLQETNRLNDYMKCVANNVANPWIVVAYRNLFVDRAALDSAAWLEDESRQWNAASLWAEKYEPLTGTLPLIETQHHKGDLLHLVQDPAAPDVVTSHVVAFTTLATAPAAFAAAGLTYETVTNGFKITCASDGKNHWLLPRSTNLLGLFEGSTYLPPNRLVRLNVGVSRSRTFQFGGAGAVGQPQTSLGLTTQNFTLNYTGGTATRTQELLTLVTPATPAAITDTLDQVVARVFQPANAAVGTWEEQGWVMSGFGPRLLSRYALARLLPMGVAASVQNRQWSRGRLAAVGGNVTFESDRLHWREARTCDVFGLWPLPDNPWFYGPRQSRVLQDMVDAGPPFTPASGTLASAGYPPWPIAPSSPFLLHQAQTHEINADGSDFRVRGLRGLPTSLAIQMRAVAPQAPHLNQSRVPVTPQPDPLAGALENHLRPGWWQAHAARLEAGQFDIEDGGVKAGVSSPLLLYRYVRYPLSVEYYNNLAALVNAVRWVRPLHFGSFRLRNTSVHAGLGEWLALPANDAGLFGTKIRPATQYCALSQGTLNGPAAVFAELAGLAVRTDADLPGWNAILATPRKLLRVTPANALVTSRTSRTIAYTSWYNDRRDDYTFQYEPVLSTYDGANWAVADIAAAFGGGAYQAHYWVTLDDVRAIAEDIGYPLSVDDVGRPMRLEVFDRPLTYRLGNTMPTGTFNIDVEVPDPGEYPFVFGPAARFNVGDPVPLPSLPTDTNHSWSLPVLVPHADGEWLQSGANGYHLGEWRPADDVQVFASSGQAWSGVLTYASLGAVPYQQHATPFTLVTQAPVSFNFTANLGLTGVPDYLLRAYRAGWLHATRDLVGPAGRGELAAPWLRFRSENAPGSQVLRVPVSSFAFTTSVFSLTKPQLDARCASSEVIYPLTVVPAAGEMVAEPVVDGVIAGGTRVEQVIHWRDGWVEV